MLMGSKLIRAASHGLSTGESVVHGRAGVKVSTEHGVAACATAQKLGFDGLHTPKAYWPKAGVPQSYSRMLWSAEMKPRWMEKEISAVRG